MNEDGETGSSDNAYSFNGVGTKITKAVGKATDATTSAISGAVKAYQPDRLRLTELLANVK